MNEYLKEKLEYYCSGFYYSDQDTRELCEDFELCEPADIEDRIKNDAESLLALILNLKKDGLI